LKAVILAGGFGKRLRPLTDNLPKPLLRIGNVPIVVWQLDWLKRHGVDDVIICAGYLKEKIVKYIDDGSRFGLNVEYSFEASPLGTGGALKKAEDLLIGTKNFLMLNGDILTTLDPSELINSIDDQTKAAIAVVPLPSPYGIIEIENNGIINGFKEKPLLKSHWINAGIYSLSSSIIDDLPEKGNIESSTFPNLSTKRAIKAVKYDEIFWKSVDSHKDIEESADQLKNQLNEVAIRYRL